MREQGHQKGLMQERAEEPRQSVDARSRQQGMKVDKVPTGATRQDKAMGKMHRRPREEERRRQWSPMPRWTAKPSMLVDRERPHRRKERRRQEDPMP